MEDTIIRIVNGLNSYLDKYPKVKGFVIGMSGGVDSTICAYLCQRALQERGDLSMKVIGTYIGMPGNKQDERDRAIMAGTKFCNEFYISDDQITEDTVSKVTSWVESIKPAMVDYKDTKTLIRRGNIKARLRMIALYNLAAENNCIVIDTDNYTEHQLGFYTLHGDVGDIKPIYTLYKTDVYQLAAYLLQVEYADDVTKKIMRDVLYAIPTDGLGITVSDLEQIGASNYRVVDYILQHPDEAKNEPSIPDEVVERVLERVERNKFKDGLPYIIR